MLRRSIQETSFLAQKNALNATLQIMAHNERKSCTFDQSDVNLCDNGWIGSVLPMISALNDGHK